MLPHNIILGAVGGLILWFGWYGFNPGSTLSAMDVQGIARVSFNTTMAACSGGLVALFYRLSADRKWDLGITVNGFLAGLVAITCPCYWVSPHRRILHRRWSPAFVVVCGIDLLEYLRMDDPIGAVPVHMVCGIWGTLSLGLFATGQYGLPTPTGADVSALVTGLFYGGGAAQLTAQAIGSASITVATLVAASALMYAVHLTGNLRVSTEGELEGLDLHEHGMLAYPEFPMHPSPRLTTGPAHQSSAATTTVPTPARNTI